MNNELIVDAIGAFFGAFFAYFFMRLLTNINERKSKRRERISNLMKMQIILNEHLDINSSNMKNIEALKSFYESANQKNTILVTAELLYNLEIERSVFNSLPYQNFFNKLFSYSRIISKFNNDLTKSENLHLLFRDSFLKSGTIDPSIYKSQFEYYVLKLQELNLFCQNFEQKIISLLAEVKLLLKMECSLLHRFFLIKASEKKITEAALSTEIENIKQQICNVNDESQKEIDEIMKKV